KGAGGGQNSWYCADALCNLAQKCLACCGSLIPPGGQLQARAHEPRRLEPDVELAETPERARHQAGSDQEQQREPDFGDQQDFAEPSALGGASSPRTVQ